MQLKENTAVDEVAYSAYLKVDFFVLCETLRSANVCLLLRLLVDLF